MANMHNIVAGPVGSFSFRRVEDPAGNGQETYAIVYRKLNGDEVVIGLYIQVHGGQLVRGLRGGPSPSGELELICETDASGRFFIGEL